VPDSATGVALPVTAEAPLPLEAEAMRAATAARRPRPAPRRVAAAIPPLAPTAAAPAATPAAMTGATALAGPTLPSLAANPAASLAANPAASLAAAVAEHPLAPARQRRAARRRMATQRLFADLAASAGIPAESYAVGEVVDGALCLVQTEQGFQVFHSAAGARHELQVFATEESACFYLFGVLAAEAVRNGSLAPVFVPAGLSAGHPETV
jgi:hypothetical protein